MLSFVIVLVCFLAPLRLPAPSGRGAWWQVCQLRKHACLAALGIYGKCSENCLIPFDSDLDGLVDVTPMVAAIAMSASSIVVTVNALRMRPVHKGDTSGEKMR